jgi:hypothetical protein
MACTEEKVIVILNQYVKICTLLDGLLFSILRTPSGKATIEETLQEEKRI